VIFGATATHALRALAHLAAVPGEQAMLGRDLAKEVGVPAHYLAKVLATLARAGLLSASRGVRGGYRLARPAREIALVDIVEPFEGKRVRPGCLLQPDQPCREERSCSAHRAWSEAKSAYSTFLETTTLADIQGAAGRGAGRGAAAPEGGKARDRRRKVRHRAPGTHPGTSAPLRARA
jgi:Rrf2 family protein